MNGSVADQHDTPPSPAYDASVFVPRFPRGLLRDLAADALLPWIAVQVLTRGWGVSTPAAVAVAAAFPAAWIAVNWARRRRLDLIGLVILVTLVGAIAVVLTTGDVRFVLLKAAPGAALFGLACLVSLAARRPLMFFVARQFTAGDDPARLAAWNERVGIAAFRRAMRLLTLVWGLAFLGKAILWGAAALLLPTNAALIVIPTLGFGILGALFAWTIAFARRRSAQGQGAAA